MHNSAVPIKSNILITGQPGIGYTTTAVTLADILGCKEFNIETLGYRPSQAHTGQWFVDLNALAYKIDDLKDHIFHGFGQNLHHIMRLDFKYVFYLYTNDFQKLLDQAKLYRDTHKITERSATWTRDAITGGAFLNALVNKLIREFILYLKIIPISIDSDPIAKILMILQKGRNVYAYDHTTTDQVYSVMAEEASELAEAAIQCHNGDDSQEHVALEWLDLTACVKLVPDPVKFLNDAKNLHITKCETKGYPHIFQDALLDWLMNEGLSKIKQDKETRQ